MNDFTKEELEILKDSMYGINFDRNDDKILRHKLQSMIDNYDVQVIEIWPCEKCGHVQ